MWVGGGGVALYQFIDHSQYKIQIIQKRNNDLKG